MSLLVVAGITLSGCGPLGDEEDETPTATADSIAQPTETAGATEDSQPTQGTEVTGGPEIGTPPPFLASPSPPAPSDQTGPFSTPVGVATPDIPSFSPGDGTPVASPDTGTNGTTAQSTETGPTFSGSDGTSGATPSLEQPLDGVAGNEGTPGAATPFFVREEATPPAFGTPQVGELDELSPIAVDGCETDQIPSFNGDVTQFVTVIDVNFRTGPGADCEQIGDDPISADVEVTLLSGPVVREDDTEFVWVQVDINGEVGWIVTSAITPVP